MGGHWGIPIVHYCRKQNSDIFNNPKTDFFSIMTYFATRDHLQLIKVLKLYKLTVMTNLTFCCCFFNSLLTKWPFLAVYWLALYTIDTLSQGDPKNIILCVWSIVSKALSSFFSTSRTVKTPLSVNAGVTMTFISLAQALYVSWAQTRFHFHIVLHVALSARAKTIPNWSCRKKLTLMPFWLEDSLFNPNW